MKNGRKAWVAAVVAVFVASGLPRAQAAPKVLRIGGYHFFKYADPACATGALATGFAAFHFDQCALVTFTADGGGETTDDGSAPLLDPEPGIEVRFVDQSGTRVFEQQAAKGGGVTGSLDDEFEFLIFPPDWGSGEVDVEPGTMRFDLVPTDANYILTGQTSFQFGYNQLGTRVILDRPEYPVGPGGLPAADLVVRGTTWEKYNKASFIGSDPTDPAPNPDLVAGEVTVTLTKKDGTIISATDTADGVTGEFDVTFAASAIGDVSAGAAEGFETALKVAASATYQDPETGLWGTAVSDTEREAYALFAGTPDRAQVRTKFVSERGWVAPGEEYVHDVEYRNASAVPATGVTVTDALPENAVFVSADPGPDSVSGNTLTWNIGTVAAGTDWPSGADASNRIVVTARARTATENPQILHQDLSDTATLSQTGQPDESSKAHGPRVSTLDTARYGDRPFPVALVEYQDNKHAPAATAWTFYNRISNERNPVSLYTHYQNMSFGQLFPHGEMASLEPDDDGFTPGPFKWSNPYLKGNTCTGTSVVPPDPGGLDGPPASVESTPPGSRVVDGWYQLPATRNYYGQDGGGSAIAPVGDLDSGCGPTGKMAYDAASISDPDLDYNEFDSDRNCLVDFFEIVFQGRGGNGDSQTHGYDNVWPHSGNLQDSYVDENGLTGYVSNDQCRDRLERPLWWTDETRSAMTTTDKGDNLKARVRVGPYNVNPENGTTSVFAHEYGHSLGLPDFYSNNSEGRSTFDFWELMAQDGFQYMTVFSRQDLGWIVPKRVPTSITTPIVESKVDTHRIDEIDANGNPYTIEGPDVHNADTWYVELPHQVLIETVPSGKYAWYSTAGNQFGCPGKYLDLDLRNLQFAPEGSAPKLTFKSWYEIEWDFDYGFVMISTDGGATFTSLTSAKGTTTPDTYNPNAVVCQQQYGNGITGTSAATGFPTNLQQRLNGAYPDPVFIDDEFDLSACVGEGCILRFAYSTDTGLAFRGWVMDDIKVADAETTYFSDDVETQKLGSYFPSGWVRFPAGPSPFDHGYYIELRDRVSNDFDSAGQGERHPLDWIPGVSVIYTNEAHGSGNVGVDDPPAQTPIDARRQPLEIAPRLADAAFFPLPGLNKFSDTQWVENYDEANEDWMFDFKCFTMNVNSLSGLGTLGDANASLTMTANPDNCLKVLAIGQGKPKPKPKPPAPPAKPLPETGLSSLPATLMVAAVAAALFLRTRRQTPHPS